MLKSSRIVCVSCGDEFVVCDTICFIKRKNITSRPCPACLDKENEESPASTKALKYFIYGMILLTIGVVGRSFAERRAVNHGGGIYLGFYGSILGGMINLSLALRFYLSSPSRTPTPRIDEPENPISNV